MLVGTLERYEDSVRLCHIRGQETIIIELAEPLGAPNLWRRLDELHLRLRAGRRGGARPAP